MNDRLGKYRLIAQLGQGGMATVFLSIVPGPSGVNKLLVVKLLRGELAQDGDFLSMFLNEARLAARLNHANVVTTYEVGFEGGHHFLAMDYLDGQPLNAVLRKVTREKMPLDVHVRILADTLAGLDYAHTLTDFDGTPLYVVHRDVSPQNVFVTYDGQVKLVDFGIAKAAGAAATTQSGVFKGKLAYVAPEQACGQPVDARADVFSVGVMLWEAMAGRRFAHGEGETAMLARRLAGTEPRIRDVVPDADPELADICDRAMAHQPNDRYPNARAFQDALEGFLDRFRRRVGRREIGELVSHHFVDRRETIRAIIDEQLKRVLRETSLALPMPTIDLAPMTTVDHTPITMVEPSARRGPDVTSPIVALPMGPDPGPGSVSGTHASLVTASGIQGAPPRPHALKGRAVFLGLGAFALTLVAGIVLVITMKKPRTDVVVDAAAAPTTTNERVELRIEFGPSAATARLDGVPLAASPFVAQVARDGTMHRIEVEAPGMAPKSTLVSYDKDVSISIVLAPETTPSDSAPPTGVATPTSAMPSAGDKDGAKRPSGRPADTTKNPKQPREIDEADPYKK